MKKFYWSILFAGLISSCAPLSREVMRQVDPVLTFAEVQRDPERYRGKVVLWGGKIIETINRPNETVIKVAQTELDLEKRPKNLDTSQGRFLVRYSGFLDPAIYGRDREITVAGEVAGKEVQQVGTMPYPYPVILAREIYLWEKPDRYYRYPPPWYFEPYPYWWYRPYWRYRHPFWW
ncbi:MAG: Slp family lipoprotein [Deltaproteobacteria bacterium]|nr:Slp family lipoprotein [Deltaproteobacteria bacterium]